MLETSFDGRAYRIRSTCTWPTTANGPSHGIPLATEESTESTNSCTLPINAITQKWCYLHQWRVTGFCFFLHPWKNWPFSASCYKLHKKEVRLKQSFELAGFNSLICATPTEEEFSVPHHRMEIPRVFSEVRVVTLHIVTIWDLHSCQRWLV